MDQKIVNYVGYIASILAILMLSSFADQIWLNMQGKTGSLILPFFTTLNCTAWTFYGFFKTERDWKIVAPNSLGIILGTITEISGMYCRSACVL